MQFFEEKNYVIQNVRLFRIHYIQYCKSATYKGDNEVFNEKQNKKQIIKWEEKNVTDGFNARIPVGTGCDRISFIYDSYELLLSSLKYVKI